MTGTKYDRDMTGVLYGGVQGKCHGRCSMITTSEFRGESGGGGEEGRIPPPVVAAYQTHPPLGRTFAHFRRPKAK